MLPVGWLCFVVAEQRGVEILGNGFNLLIRILILPLILMDSKSLSVKDF